MLVVLEGPDGAGKTTLAAQLEREYWAAGAAAGFGGKRRKSSGRRVVQLHTGPPPPDRDAAPMGKLERAALRAAELRERVAGYDPDGSELWVLDRWMWGAVVYGRLYRPQFDVDGWGDLPLAEVCALERDLAALGGTTVLLMPPAEELVRRSRADEAAAARRGGGARDPYLDSVGSGESRAQQLRDIRESYWQFALSPSSDVSRAAGSAALTSWDGVPLCAAPGDTDPATGEKWPPRAYLDDPRRVALSVLRRAADAQAAARERLRSREAAGRAAEDAELARQRTELAAESPGG